MEKLYDYLSVEDLKMKQTPLVEINAEETLAARITVSLRNAIVRGEIAPGTKLSEPKLAEAYQVSRGPLREALRRLETINLVSHVPHEGVRVITLTKAQVLDIYEVREALEGKAAALAARNMSADQVTQLRNILTLAKQHIISTQGTYLQADADIDFHYQVIQGSSNPALIRILCEELYYLIHMYRCQSSLDPARSNEALKEHEHLLYAIERKDEALAEMVMRKHIERARLNIQEKIF